MTLEKLIVYAAIAYVAYQVYESAQAAQSTQASTPNPCQLPPVTQTFANYAGANT